MTLMAKFYRQPLSPSLSFSLSPFLFLDVNMITVQDYLSFTLHQLLWNHLSKAEKNSPNWFWVRVCHEWNLGDLEGGR
jgi:hypothetical protein